MSDPGLLMAAEMAEQPAVLDRLLREGGAEISAVRRAIADYRPRLALLAARGTSDHAALYAKYLIEVRWQLPAGLASPSTLTLYGARPDLGGVLFIAISQSGGSPDLVRSVEVARDCGALTVAVTNNLDSPLAQAVEHRIDVRAGAERAVAATKSYTAQLLALHQLLANAIDNGDAAAAPDAAALPDAAAGTLELAGHAHAAAARYRFADRMLATARGYSYATAREAALKIMETCYLPAQAFSGADLLHGPLAMIDAAMPVIAVVTPGAGGRAMAPVVDRLTRAGAHVLPVTAAGNGPTGAAAEGRTLPIAADGIPETLLPVLEILPLQQLAWRLAIDRGGDPDRPRGLSKVTETW